MPPGKEQRLIFPKILLFLHADVELVPSTSVAQNEVLTLYSPSYLLELMKMFMKTHENDHNLFNTIVSKKKKRFKKNLVRVLCFLQSPSHSPSPVRLQSSGSQS